MANQEHLDILRQGAEVWNKWREENPEIKPDLSGAELREAILREINFVETNLSMTKLDKADLYKANLAQVNLTRASLIQAKLTYANFFLALLDKVDLSQAELSGASFYATNLLNSNLRRANLMRADFTQAKMNGADLNEAQLIATIFGLMDLRHVKGLDNVTHAGPSIIGIDVIYRSHGDIPEVFLKGAGVDNSFITYMRSLVEKPIDYYSCFISYSSKDDAFARRLYADLQNHNVRCWFAPEDLKIGDKFRHRIDESIRMYDKLLLVLSEVSLASTWVSYEVEKALNKEPEGIPNVLFPIRLDKTILTCETDWAKDIRKSRHIGNFEHWKDHDAYQIAFKRLLRDLKAQS
jgi:uncharacterized protein YjbI with pentapeptide repeats